MSFQRFFMACRVPEKAQDQEGLQVLHERLLQLEAVRTCQFKDGLLSQAGFCLGMLPHSSLRHAILMHSQVDEVDERVCASPACQVLGSTEYVAVCI